MSDAKPIFFVRQFARSAWVIIDRRDGLPIYDGSPYGNDRPVIFRDPDDADECVERLNSKVTDE